MERAVNRLLYRNIRVSLSCLLGLGLLLSGRPGAKAHQGEDLGTKLVPTGATLAPGGTSAAREEVPPVSQLFEIYECTTCHRLTTPHRLIGPSLWKIGERASAAFIRTSILDPDAVVAPGYPAGVMHARLQELGFYTDIARQPAILERLVAYLTGQEAASVSLTPPDTPTPGMTQIPTGTIPLPNDQVAEIEAFTIDAVPVTLAQYAAFITAGGYTVKRYWEREGWALIVQRRKRLHPTDWEAQQRQSGEHLVSGVTWYEADAYCRWTGKALPTAAQWERACREVSTWAGPEAHWEWTAEA